MFATGVQETGETGDDELVDNAVQGATKWNAGLDAVVQLSPFCCATGPTKCEFSLSVEEAGVEELPCDTMLVTDPCSVDAGVETDFKACRHGVVQMLDVCPQA